MRVSGKPAIRFKINNTWQKAFLDTGAANNTATKEIVENSNIISKKEHNYGGYRYYLYTLLVDEVLNLYNTNFQFTDFGRTVDESFNIKMVFGRPSDKTLSFDLKNRVVRFK